MNKFDKKNPENKQLIKQIIIKYTKEQIPITLTFGGLTIVGICGNSVYKIQLYKEQQSRDLFAEQYQKLMHDQKAMKILPINLMIIPNEQISLFTNDNQQIIAHMLIFKQPLFHPFTFPMCIDDFTNSMIQMQCKMNEWGYLNIDFDYGQFGTDGNGIYIIDLDITFQKLLEQEEDIYIAPMDEIFDYFPTKYQYWEFSNEVNKTVEGMNKYKNEMYKLGGYTLKNKHFVFKVNILAILHFYLEYLYCQQISQHMIKNVDDLDWDHMDPTIHYKLGLWFFNNQEVFQIQWTRPQQVKSSPVISKTSNNYESQLFAFSQ